MEGTFGNFTAPPLRKMPDFKFVRPRSFWWVHSTPVKDAPPLLRVRGSACIGWRAIADHVSFLRGLLASQLPLIFSHACVYRVSKCLTSPVSTRDNS